MREGRSGEADQGSSVMRSTPAVVDDGVRNSSARRVQQLRRIGGIRRQHRSGLAAGNRNADEGDHDGHASKHCALTKKEFASDSGAWCDDTAHDAGRAVRWPSRPSRLHRHFVPGSCSRLREILTTPAPRLGGPAGRGIRHTELVPAISDGNAVTPSFEHHRESMGPDRMPRFRRPASTYRAVPAALCRRQGVDQRRGVPGRDRRHQSAAWSRVDPAGDLLRLARCAVQRGPSWVASASSCPAWY